LLLLSGYEIIPIETIEKGLKNMSNNILCAITLRDETLSELLDPAQELDVSSLKDDADAKPSQEEQEEDAENQARLIEIETIKEFLAAKKAREAANPQAAAKNKLEAKKTPTARKNNHWNSTNNGRPRKSFFKEVTFVVQEDGTFKLAGRGRPGKQPREKFTVFYSHAQRLVTTESYTLKQIKGWAKK
jgi:hypothetical protein